MNFLLPFKGLQRAKSRWQTDETDRQTLVLRLLEQNLQAVARVVGEDRVHLVSPDGNVRERFPQYRYLATPGKGLNQDLQAAREQILDSREPLAVLLPDLPQLTSAEVEQLVEQAQQHELVLCPAHDNVGTNAIALSPYDCLPFLFEGESFARFHKAAQNNSLRISILRAPGLARDCDDLETLRKYCLL